MMAPTRETQVELKINHGNQGFENLFTLYSIWSNIYIYIYIYTYIYIYIYIYMNKYVYMCIYVCT